MSGITVREAMTVLDDCGLYLLAGESGLDNVITDVSVLEILIPGQEKKWIAGGELILSTLHAFNSEQDRIDLVDVFSKNKVSAMIVHPGANNEFNFQRGVLDKANRVGLPIFTVPQNVAYVKIITAVYGYILNKQATQLRKSELINRNLSSILISGGEEAAIAQALGNLLEKPLLILDEKDRVLARCDYSENGKKIIDAFSPADKEFWESAEESKTNDSNISYNHLVIDGKEYKQTIYRHYFMEEYFGAIIIWGSWEHGGDDIESQMDLDGLHHAATSLSLIEIKKRASRETMEKQITSFYDDLLNQRFETTDAIFTRAGHLNISTNNSYQAIIVDLDDFEHYCTVNAKRGEKHFQDIKNTLGVIIKNAFGQIREKKTIIPVSDCFIIILSINPKSTPQAMRENLNGIFHLLGKEVSRLLPSITVTTGVGTVKPSLSLLPGSYSEAKSAIYLANKIQGAGSVCFYGDMGIYGLLAVKDLDEFKENCRSALKDLALSNKKGDDSLLDTLETYLDYNERILPAANALDVHPNTVKYRIKRAKMIFGQDIFTKNEEKLKIHLILKMRKLI